MVNSTIEKYLSKTFCVICCYRTEFVQNQSSINIEIQIVLCNGPCKAITIFQKHRSESCLYWHMHEKNINLIFVVWRVRLFIYSPRLFTRSKYFLVICRNGEQLRELCLDLTRKMTEMTINFSWWTAYQLQ